MHMYTYTWQFLFCVDEGRSTQIGIHMVRIRSTAAASFSKIGCSAWRWSELTQMMIEMRAHGPATDWHSSNIDQTARSSLTGTSLSMRAFVMMMMMIGVHCKLGC